MIAGFTPGTFQSRSAIDAAPASTSVIKSIQSGTVTIGASSASGTATITSVTTANAILLWNGETTSNASTSLYSGVSATIALTNATTVTATRGNLIADTVTVSFTVIEFASGVNSIQSGSITIAAGGTSNTATISAVGANAFVLWLGASNVGGGLLYSNIGTSVVLTNSTTVTANCQTGLASNTIVGYMVVDLDSTIVTSVQQRALTGTAAAGSETDTITSVTTGNTLLFYNGTVRLSGAVDVDFFSWTQVLTNATTVTFTRTNTASTISRTHYYTVVQFAAGALNGNVQRGTIALSAQTSNTATISSVTTTKSFVNWGAFLSATGNADVVQPALTLTNGTTVTASVNSAGSPTVSYEVIQFK